VRLQTRAARPVLPSPVDDSAPPGVSDENRAQLKRLAEVRAKILQRYVKSVSDQEVTDGAIQGMVAALHDPYSEYLAPERVAALEKELGGTLSGIGVQVHLKDGRSTVVTPLEDSPALKAGLQPGDVILAIDDQPTRGLDLQEVVRRILGPEGSPIKLRIRHPDGAEVSVTFPRAHIQVRSVQGFRRRGDGRWQYLIDPAQRIGYVRICRFSATTVQDLRDALGSLNDDRMRGLILDLRCSPGGLLRAAVDTARLFLAHGTIVSVRSPGQVEQSWEADGQSLVGDVPLVVLLNENTASAAEVVAGALKDNHRAVLVGTRSFGKGSVQEVIKLEQGRGALRLTTAYYHLPNGRNIHKHPGAATWGVDPTDGYYVPLDAAQTTAYFDNWQQRMVLGKAANLPPVQEKLTPERIAQGYADPQLAAAFRTLTARLTTGAFVKVGESNADLLAHLGRRQEMERRRDELLESLEQVNKELAELEGTKASCPNN
jgi:carboxyl-terminal processing protease